MTKQETDERAAIRAAAHEYIAAGLSVLPLMADKRPRGEWKQYQTERATPEEAAAWDSPGVGIVGGAISGNLWVLDFDHGAADIFPQWERLINASYPALARELAAAPIVATGGGGYHVYFRLPAARGNETLAAAYVATDGRRKLEKRIETRGAGGYVVAPPSPHPSGRRYEWIRPPAGYIPQLGDGQLSDLLAACRSFDERTAAANPPPEPPRMAQDGRAASRGDIPPLDVLRGILGHIPPWGIPYEDWIKVLMGIHAAYPDADGLALAEEWGQGKPGEVGGKWKGFTRDAGGVGVGTLIKMAKERGYTPTQTSGRPGGYHELRDEPPPYYDIGPGPDIPPDEPPPELAAARAIIPAGLHEVALVDNPQAAERLNADGLAVYAVAYPDGLRKEHAAAMAALGVERVIVAMSNPPAVEAAIRALLRAPHIEGVLVAMAAQDEPLDLIAQDRGIAAADEVLAAAVRAGAWIADYLTAGTPPPLSDVEEERLLSRVVDIYTWLRDKEPLQAERLLNVIEHKYDIRRDELLPRLERAYERKRHEATRDSLGSLLSAAAQANAAGDIERTRDLLDTAAQDFRGVFVEYPAPYTMARLEEDLQTEPAALPLPWKELNGVCIPRAGLSVIAADTGRGKTTMMLNLAAHYATAPQWGGERVYFYTYEEPASHLAIKMIMILAGVALSPDLNFYDYRDYIRNRANGLGGMYAAAVEEAIKQFTEATESGRLVIVDSGPDVDELAAGLAMIARTGQTTAVFVDYVQRIPPPPSKRPASVRYLEIAAVAQTLRRAAVAHGLAIVTGSQVNPTGDLREAKDIAHEAQVILKLGQVDTAGGDAAAAAMAAADLRVKVEKQRAGRSGQSAILLWDKTTLQIRSNPTPAAVTVVTNQTKGNKG